MKKSAKAVVTSATLFVTGVANAAVPAAVDTAISTMAADAVTVATAILVAIIGVVAIKFIRKGL
jgi:hypothetical protein